MNDSEKLLHLKRLILNEDWNAAQRIFKRLDELDKELPGKMDTIVTKRLDKYTSEIPEKLGPVITQALSEEIKNSQDRVVDALFPIIGKMIKKYIQKEIAILQENINKQLRNTFSIFSFRSKSKKGTPKTIELIKSEIEQVFVIEKGSGLIIGSYTKHATVDEDMISGMLTAIKSFVEDAFQGGQQSLELIQYELYKIHIQNFSSYYIAFVISGPADDSFRSKLEDKLFDFSEQYMKGEVDKLMIANKLANFFAS